MPSKKSVNPAIDAIIFDLGKVIVEYDHSLICSRLARLGRLAPEQVRAAIFDSGLEDRFDRGLVSPEDFHRALARSTGMELGLRQLQTIWSSHFSLIDGTVRIIRELQRYRLFCLSNTNRWHFDYCRSAYSVLALFDDWILSCDVGARKPEPAIFMAALDRAGVSPRRCVFIDDVELFVRAARNLGMHGIVFTTPGRLRTELRALGIPLPNM